MNTELLIKADSVKKIEDNYYVVSDEFPDITFKIDTPAFPGMFVIVDAVKIYINNNKRR